MGHAVVQRSRALWASCGVGICFRTQLLRSAQSDAVGLFHEDSNARGRAWSLWARYRHKKTAAPGRRVPAVSYFVVMLRMRSATCLLYHLALPVVPWPAVWSLAGMR